MSSTKHQEDEAIEFKVEKILDKRKKRSTFEFLVKWLGYPDSENTWEPPQNLNDKHSKRMIKEYESNQLLINRPVSDTKKMIGFKRGLSPEKVLGASKESGELQLLIKWKGIDEADLVKAKDAHVICPQLVIKFYEESVRFSS